MIAATTPRSRVAGIRAGLARRPLFAASALAAIYLSFEYIALGPYSWIYGYGAGLETIPVHLALLKTGSTFALWAPSVGGGFDRLSFWGNADPFNLEPLLFALFPVWLANGLHMLLQRFLAMYFAARVGQEQLRLPTAWCIVLALVHGGFSYFTIGDTMAIAAVPLLVWLLPHLAERPRWPFWALGGGVLFSALTTFSQGAPYHLVFAFGWFALVLGVRSPRLYLATLLFFAAQAIVKAPAIAATLANAPFSHRAGFPLEPLDLFTLSGLVYYQQRFDFLDQDKLLRAITIWTPPLALGPGLLVALAREGRGSGARQFLAVAALYALLSFRLGFVLAQHAVAVALPWISGLDMSRFYNIPSPFLLAVVITTGARLVYSSLPRGLVRRTAVVGLGAYLAFMLSWPKVSLYYPLMIDSWGEQAYQVRALDDLRIADTGLYRVASVLDLQPGYAYAQGFETADGWSNLYPAVYRELWLRVVGPLMVNVPGPRNVFDPPGGRPQDHYLFLGTGLIVPGQGQLPGEDPAVALSQGFDVEQRFNLGLLGMLNVRYVLANQPLRAPGLTLVHAPATPPTLTNHDYATGLLNVPPHQVADLPLAERPGRVITDTVDAIRRKRAGKDVYIYALAYAVPRFRFVERAEVVPNGPAALDRLSAMTPAEIASTAIIEADAGTIPFADPSRAFATGTVSLACYSPEVIDLSVSGQGDGFLVAAMTWNPFWRATVDGRPAALLRTNHAQLGLVVPVGAQAVRLAYEPPYGWLLPRLPGLAPVRCP